MKSEDVKTAAGYQAIKAKTIQFPPDLIDIKSRSLVIDGYEEYCHTHAYGECPYQVQRKVSNYQAWRSVELWPRKSFKKIRLQFHRTQLSVKAAKRFIMFYRREKNRPSRFLNNRQHSTKSSLDVSVPPLYALRFLTPSSTAAHEEHAVSRASKNRSTNSVLKEDDKRLPPVELTINKKIKFPAHNKLQRQLTDREKHDLRQLASSDREVIEQLRQHLRTQPHNGTTSVLEAIADPQIREERLYYEPLSTFLENKDFTNSEKLLSSTGSVRVVNIMVPTFSNDREATNGHDLVLSRHQAMGLRQSSRKKGGAVRTYSYLPKVIGSSISRKEDNRLGGKQSSDTTSNSQNSMDSSILLPRMGDENFPLKGAYLPRKTPVNLPKLTSKREDDFGFEVRDGTSRRRKGVVPIEQSHTKRNANAVQLPPGSDQQSPGLVKGFPRRATTTATGKSHLIGPMNKMDMIAYYGRAMQERLISYDEYIKKLSVLSLHKVTMPNSSLRHFQIVRDEAHNKPRLTHVDVSPMTAPQPGHVKSLSAPVTKILRPEMPGDRESKTSGSRFVASNDSAQHEMDLPRLHRIDIGAELTNWSDESKFSPDLPDEIVTTDLNRYTQMHHPRLGRQTHQYHWNHEAAYGPNGTVKENGKQHLRDRHWAPGLGAGEMSQRDTAAPLNLKDAILEHSMGSPEKQRGIRHAGHSMIGFSPRKLGSLSQQDLPTIGEGDDTPYDIITVNSETVHSVRTDIPPAGKIPYGVSDHERLGFAGNDVVSALDYRVAPILGEDTDTESTDAESVFQPHLENMLKTIKKAKATKKKRVPEFAGLAPTVMPQLLVQNVNGEIGDSVLRVAGNTPDRLKVQRHVLQNTPPPSARDRRETNSHRQQHSLAKSSDKLENNSISPQDPKPHSEDVKIVIDPASSQVTAHQGRSRDSTPHTDGGHHVPRIASSDKEYANRLNSAEVRVMSASVDLGSIDAAPGEKRETPSRLEVVIKSVPTAPPASLASDNEALTEAEDQ